MLYIHLIVPARVRFSAHLSPSCVLSTLGADHNKCAIRPSPQGSDNSDWGVPLDSPPPATASSPQGPGDNARDCGTSESDGTWGCVPLNSSGCALQIGGLCGVPGRRTQESGEGPGAAWDGESRPESSTFSGEEEEKGEGLEVKPRLLEPGGKGVVSSRLHPHRAPSSYRPRPH